MHIAADHGAFGVMDMQLQPAQALEVERLELVPALAADEAGPRIKMRVQQRRPAEGVGLATTRTVVSSAVLTLVLDYMLPASFLNS